MRRATASDVVKRMTGKIIWWKQDLKPCTTRTAERARQRTKERVDVSNGIGAHFNVVQVGQSLDAVEGGDVV